MNEQVKINLRQFIPEKLKKSVLLKFTAYAIMLGFVAFLLYRMLVRRTDQYVVKSGKGVKEIRGIQLEQTPDKQGDNKQH